MAAEAGLRAGRRLAAAAGPVRVRIGRRRRRKRPRAESPEPGRGDVERGPRSSCGPGAAGGPASPLAAGGPCRQGRRGARDLRVGAEAAQYAASGAAALARHQIRIRQRPAVGDRRGGVRRRQQLLADPRRHGGRVSARVPGALRASGAADARAYRQEPAHAPLPVAAVQQPGGERLWGGRRGGRPGPVDRALLRAALGAGGRRALPACGHLRIPVGHWRAVREPDPGAARGARHGQRQRPQ